MCRLFALRARKPLSVYESLVNDPHSLRKQSHCDARKENHEDGWGIGYYVDGAPIRVRSPGSATNDPTYEEMAQSIQADTLLAHVRQASMGEVLEKNCHPFSHGRWLFAHNGTVEGFPRVRAALRQSLPQHLRECIGGDTDSELAFYLLLAELETTRGALEAPHPRALCQVITTTIRRLEKLCPGTEDEPSRFNFVLTDGRMMVASRWGHSLYWVQKPDGAIALASEPTTAEAWLEIPDRSLFWVDHQLAHGLEI